MRLIYSFIITLFTGLVRLASLFNNKAKLWAGGRKGWRKKLRERVNGTEKRIWIHCASLGEFEQGRPLMEMIKERSPQYKIILTFFSPSGYELRKEWPVADVICYLPADTPRNAHDFIEICKPSMVLFIKYEFWNNYISELDRRNIPLYLVSGIFRPGQHFFKWYGGFFRNMLNKFSHIFLQDDRSFNLLESAGIRNISVTGDTRFDRVSKIVRAAETIPVIEKFRGNEKLFLAGSSWKEDEEIIAAYINSDPGRMKWAFAPHKIEKSNIDRLEKLFSTEVVRYSCFNEESHKARVLIIDNIGLLSSAYRYAHFAAIGGGFGDGIHSILESVCWGVPVLFGPNYNGFREAYDLIEDGGAFCYKNREEFSRITDRWLNDEETHKTASIISSDYVTRNTGATERVYIFLSEHDINKK